MHWDKNDTDLIPNGSCVIVDQTNKYVQRSEICFVYTLFISLGSKNVLEFLAVNHFLIRQRGGVYCVYICVSWSLYSGRKGNSFRRGLPLSSCLGLYH